MPELIEIDDYKAPELDVFTRLDEPQLRHYYEPDGGLFLAESLRVIELALDAGYRPAAMLLEDKTAKSQAADVLARVGDIPVYTASKEVMNQIPGFNITRGALCAMHRPPDRTAQEVLRGASRVAVLENVMNPTNVGAIIRSAAALGIDAVLLTPGCSDPLYRRALRVSMGTSLLIPWAYLGSRSEDWPAGGMALLHERGFKAAAMALTDRSTGIDDPAIKACSRLAIVLGTEGDGLAPETIAACDFTAKIPMSHGVDSLNVAAASAVAFWEMAARQRL